MNNDTCEIGFNGRISLNNRRKSQRKKVRENEAKRRQRLAATANR
jgi:hypothetical protein